MQRKPQSSSISQQNIIKLPSNFANQVMDLELQIEIDPKVQMEKVNRLVELYSLAVQYYESIKSNNVIVFKNKIAKLMLKPSLNKLGKQIKQFQNTIVSDKETNLKQKNQENKRQSLEQILEAASNNSQVNARRMMMGIDTQYQSVAKKIGNQINKQQSKIEQRLRMRKVKAEIISMSSTQCDPKQSNQNVDIFTFETILQSNDGVEQDKKQQQKCVQQIKTVIQQIEKASIQQQQPPKPVKTKVKKNVLTLKPNQSSSTLPTQFNIPF